MSNHERLPIRDRWSGWKGRLRPQHAISTRP